MGMQPSSVAAKLFRDCAGDSSPCQVITRRVAASQTINVNDILTVNATGFLIQAIVDTGLDNGEAVYNAALSLPLYYACQAITTGASISDAVDKIAVVQLTSQVILELRCVAGGASGTPSAISSTGTAAASLQESESYALCRVKQNDQTWYAMGAGQTNGVCRLIEISAESYGTADTYAIVRVALA